MEWLQGIFDQHGGTAISVLVGFILVILFIAMIDGHKVGVGKDRKTRRDD